MTKQFAVVVFKSDNSVLAVPLTWISEDEKFCAWPPGGATPKILKNPSSQPGEDWSWLDIDLKNKYSACVVLIFLTVEKLIIG